MSSERETIHWNQFRALVAEKLEIPVERIERNSLFVVDLKADSLDIVDLLLELEDRYQIALSEKEAAKLETAGAIFDYVYARMSASTP